MHKFYIFIISALLFQGCIYSDMTHLSNDDLQWIDGFYNDSYLEYRSDKNNLDTVFISRLSIQNSSCPIYVSDNYYDTFTANASVSCFFRSNPNYNYLLFYLERSIENRDTLSMDIVSDHYDVNDKFISPEKTFSLGDFQTKDQSWDNCMIVDLDYIHPPFDKHCPKRFLKTIVIQKGHGLVYYKYFDGEEFFFKRIIKRK